MASGKQAARILLVHGALHGAWCWEDVLPRLAACGIEALAIDLPGLGDDPTPLAEVTFAAYVQSVVDAASAFDGPMVLAGHSMGGNPISAAAEVLGSRVAGLVYVAAVVPLPGESANAAGERIFASGESLFMRAATTSADGLTIDIDRDAGRAAFFNTSPAVAAERALDRIRPQATAPMGATIETSDAVWGAIPKTYVLCRQDRAIPPAIQRWMCERVPGMAVREMDTDHSPFYSDPEGLAEILAAAAGV